MSLSSILKSIETAVTGFFGHSTIGNAILTEGKSVVHQAVAIIKQSDIGATIAADVKAIETKTNPDGSKMTGLQKFNAVVANTVPEILKLIASGGLSAVESEVIGIAQEVVQATFNEEVSTQAGAAAVLILKASGVDVPTGVALAAKV